MARQGRLISARRRSLRSSHRPAGLEAGFLKEPDRASASTPLQADGSNWLRTVAEDSRFAFSSCAGTAQDQTLRIVFPFSAGGAADGIADAEAEALIVAASL
jgi:hypothetical protein